MTEAYPLHWPPGRPRTKRRAQARFDVSAAKARDGLMKEISLLGGRYAVLSSNAPVRQDGLLYSKFSEPVDPGVAVYFERKGRQMAFACDRWDRVRDNIQAIRHTIGALRGIERWGTGDMVEAAFTGFTSLPPAVDGQSPWWHVLNLEPDATRQDAEAAYKRMARLSHPDHGGDANEMMRLNEAIRQVRAR